MHTARNALATASLIAFLLGAGTLGCGTSSAPASDMNTTHTTGGSGAPVPLAPSKEPAHDKSTDDAAAPPPVPPPATKNVGQQTQPDVTHR